MKWKVFPIGFFLSAFMILSAQAQSNDSGSNTINVNVAANVINGIDLITIRSMGFGDARPSEGEIYINPILSDNAGHMKAVGISNASVQVTFYRQRELAQASGPGILSFNYQVAINSEPDQSTAELIQSDDRNFQLNEKGEIFIWIGGTVDISNARPGSYQGDFTLEIEYI